MGNRVSVTCPHCLNTDYATNGDDVSMVVSRHPFNRQFTTDAGEDVAPSGLTSCGECGNQFLYELRLEVVAYTGRVPEMALSGRVVEES